MYCSVLICAVQFCFVLFCSLAFTHAYTYTRSDTNVHLHILFHTRICEHTQPMEIFVDDDTKLTLHGLQQYYIRLDEAAKNRSVETLTAAATDSASTLPLSSPTSAYILSFAALTDTPLVLSISRTLILTLTLTLTLNPTLTSSNVIFCTVLTYSIGRPFHFTPSTPHTHSSMTPLLYFSFLFFALPLFSFFLLLLLHFLLFLILLLSFYPFYRKLNDLLDALEFNQVVIFVSKVNRAMQLNKILEVCTCYSVCALQDDCVDTSSCLLP